MSSVTLTIDAGVATTSGSDDGTGLAPALVIPPGAMINATASADMPITFTANTTELPAIGLWGGFIVMGMAPIIDGSSDVEGFIDFSHGGTDATESSGMLTYVRVWYGGSVIGEDNEIDRRHHPRRRRLGHYSRALQSCLQPRQRL